MTVAIKKIALAGFVALVQYKNKLKHVLSLFEMSSLYCLYIALLFGFCFSFVLYIYYDTVQPPKLSYLLCETIKRLCPQTFSTVIVICCFSSFLFWLSYEISWISQDIFSLSDISNYPIQLGVLSYYFWSNVWTSFNF